MHTGKQFIDGDWLDGTGEYSSQPVSGEPKAYSIATVAQVEQAANAAAKAFGVFSQTGRKSRARLLDCIADEIEAAHQEIVSVAVAETGLPDARLNGELGRTTGQLRLFAKTVRDGDYLERRVTTALPEREPIPRPDLRLMMRPIGPVAVFGASNFPLAFSTAGGDTASAFAAGCPVVVKAHPAHPGTGEQVALAIGRAIKACDLPAGIFAYLHDPGVDAATALVSHPEIKAVGFTGSLKAGRALFDICAQRKDPIPFFGELGSINPMFILPFALRDRHSDIASGYAQSLTLGAGQFCTNPGVVFVADGEAADKFAGAAASLLSETSTQGMLTASIAQACHDAASKVGSVAGVTTRLHPGEEPRAARPYLFETSFDVWRQNTALHEEVFGPVGIIVRVPDDSAMLLAAADLAGQLTATMQMDAGDMHLAQQLLPVLEQKAGRILVNGYPTGVEVDAAMMHGGPYPASTSVASTSVGTLAIRRFLKPVCYQGFPADLLPDDLRDG